MLTTVIVSRLLFVPAFYFTAKYGSQGWMIMLTCFLGLSNGYLTVCVLTSAPKGYKVSLLNNQNFSGFSKFIFRLINVVHFFNVCRDQNRMPWETCWCCFFLEVFLQV